MVEPNRQDLIVNDSQETEEDTVNDTEVIVSGVTTSVNIPGSSAPPLNSVAGTSGVTMSSGSGGTTPPVNSVPGQSPRGTQGRGSHTVTSNSQFQTGSLMATGPGSPIPSTSNQNQGGSQFVNNQFFGSGATTGVCPNPNEILPALVDHMAQMAHFAQMYGSYLQSSTPLPGSVRDRDAFPIPQYSTVQAARGLRHGQAPPPQPVLEYTRTGRPDNARPFFRPTNIQQKMMTIASGDGGSIHSQGPGSSAQGDVGSRPASEAGREHSESGENGTEGNGRNINQQQQVAQNGASSQIDRQLAAIRTENSEAQALDRELFRSLEQLEGSALGRIDGDFSASVTKIKAMDLVRWFVRINSLHEIPTTTELIRIKTEIEEIKQQLLRDGRQGPANIGWREFLSVLTQMSDRIEILRLRLGTNNEGAADNSSSANASVSTAPASTDLYLALKTIRTFDGTNPEEYFRYFSQATNNIPFEMRKTMLENNMGPKYLDRMKKIRYLNSWPAVMEEVTKEFSSTPCGVTASLALHKLKQGSRDIRRYNDKWCKLLDQMNKIPENIKDTDLVTGYLMGLSDGKMRKYLLNKLMNKDTKMEKTLHKFMELAREDEIRNKLVHGAPEEDVSSDDGDEVYVASHKKSKSRSETVRAAEETSTSDSSELCQRHDKATHPAKACRVPPGMCPYCEEKNIPAHKFQDGSHLRECAVRPCGTCGIRGHYARECFSNSRRNSGGRDTGRKRDRDSRGHHKHKHSHRSKERSKDRKDRHKRVDTHRSHRSDRSDRHRHKDRRHKYENRDKKPKRERAFVAEASDSGSTSSSGSDSCSTCSGSSSPA